MTTNNPTTQKQLTDSQPTHEPSLHDLIAENNRLQKKSLDLLYTMQRMQTVRFLISLLIILLPLIAAVVVLPRFVTTTLDDFKTRIDNVAPKGE